MSTSPGRSGEVFDRLLARGQSSSTPLTSSGCATWPPVAVDPTKQRPLVIADTRDQVAALNTAICDRLVAVGHVDDTTALTTEAGERVGPGDQVATRRNERDLAVANRDVWTVTGI